MANSNIFDKIDQHLAEYYKNLNRNDYLNSDGEGKFLQFVIEDELNEEDIEDELNDYDNCGYLEFDVNFPFAPELNNINEEQKRQQIFNILKSIYAQVVSTNSQSSEPDSKQQIYENESFSKQLNILCNEIKSDLFQKMDSKIAIIIMKEFKKIVIDQAYETIADVKEDILNIDSCVLDELTKHSALLKTILMEKKPMKILCFNKHSYISIDNAFINSIFCNNSFTLECWALPNTDLVNYKNHMILFGQKASHESGPNYAMHFGIFNFNEIGMRYNCNDINIRVKKLNSAVKYYHHFAFVYNHLTKRRKIFFDGKWIGTDCSKSNLLSSGNFMIGRTPWNKNDDWGGNIRDVRIWDIARSDQQIAKYYQSVYRCNKSLKYLFEEYIAFISECDIFTQCFKHFPQPIIEIIVNYDGCGLVACFPLIDDVDHEDTQTVIDIVSEIKGQLNGPIFWKTMK